MRRIALFVLLALALPVSAGEVLTAPPATPAPSKTYVFYLHGRIVEEKGPHAVDPRFGRYDYPAVLDALAARGAVVISQQRPQGTDMATYAGSVVGQIEDLVEAGVPENHIAVVGFSKGGGIASRVSSFLRRRDVRFVLLAACFEPKASPLRLTGRVLAIREASDTLAPESCKALAAQPDKPTAFEELVLHTGRSHGAFYQPREEWVKPTLDFVHGAPR